MNIISRFIFLSLIFLVTSEGLAKVRYLAEPGLYVSDIANREYNDSVFSSVIEKHNNFKASDLRPGAVILTPQLDDMLVEEGFPKSLKHVAYKIWSAYSLVKEFEKETKNVSKASSRSKAKMNRALANLRVSKRKLINDAKPSVPYVMIAKLDSVIKGVDSMLRLAGKPSAKQFDWLYLEFTKVYITGIDWSRERVKLLYNTGLAQ